MKKVLYLLVMLALVLAVFSACGEKSSLDVWDGSVATAFQGGDGSQDKPYEIATGAQLAYLAASVNDGNSYAGKYFILTSDIDLNHLEWAPIGDGKPSFSGTFDGRDHLIVNLKVVSGVTFTGYFGPKETSAYAAGLFGATLDAVIRNIKIDQAEIVAQDIGKNTFITAGVLVGDAKANTYTEISGISVSNGVVRSDYGEEDLLTMELYIGGIAGHMRGEEGAKCVLSEAQAEVTLSAAKGVGRDTSVGGLVGSFYVLTEGVVQNCASYATIDLEWLYSNIYLYCGAFGTITTKKTMSLTNLFSKVTVDKLSYDWYPHYFCTAYAAAGVVGISGVWDSNGFLFENVFGFVEQIDSDTGERVTDLTLYTISAPTAYTETNCMGCESLPEKHGFDTNKWDLSDPKHPNLK